MAEILGILYPAVFHLKLRFAHFTLFNLGNGGEKKKHLLNNTHSVSGQILIQDFGQVGQPCRHSFNPPPPPTLLSVSVAEVT